MSPTEKRAREALPPETKYTVTVTKKALKALSAMPETVFDIFELLREELAQEGPVQTEWTNYGQLKGQKNQPQNEKRYHCHLKRGHPTYVACWKCVDKTIEITVYFVGTYADVPY